MANADQVITLHHKNPAWTSTQIAEALDCMPEYVRSTFKRRGLTLPFARGGGGYVRYPAARLMALRHPTETAQDALNRIIDEALKSLQESRANEA